jgi:putative DNA primase/helicase
MADLDLDLDLVVEDAEPASAQQASQGQHKPSADDARNILQQHLNDLMRGALEWHQRARKPSFLGLPIAPPAAPHNAIKVTTGVGKSEQLRQAAAMKFIPEAKRRGLPHRVLIAVPTHKLAKEAREKMAAGVSVAVWQGRGGTHLATGGPMCRNPEAVEAAQKIGASVEETACKNKTARCPLYETCHYQAQKEAARKADIVFVAHEILFQVSEAIGKKFGLVIVDESFWQDGLVGTKSDMSRLVISTLASEVRQHPVRYKAVTEVESYTEDLIGWVKQLQTALNGMPDGYVQRQPLLDAGFRPAAPFEESACTIAAKREFERKVEVEFGPDSDAEERKAAVEKFGFVGRIKRRYRMWKSLDELIAGDENATGKLLLETEETRDGPVRYLHLLGRKEIAAKLVGLPMIVADATLPLELVQNFLPDLGLACDLDVAAPHMRITQVTGMPVGKSSLKPLPPGKRSADKEERVARKRQRLVEAVRHLVQGRRGLVITYQAIEGDFAGIDGLETAHFGAIEGIDRWRDVDVLITIGRPLPRPDDIQDMAAAVTGKPVIAGAPVEQECTILSGGLSGHILKRRIYTEPEAELVRQAVTEAAIEQAVGRVRGVNRTAANAVELFMVLGDTVLPGLPVDEVVTFGEIEPDSIDLMVARGLVPQLPTDAARLHPDLFPSHEAAKKAYQRDRLRTGRGRAGPRLGTWPNKKDSIRVCPQPPCVCLLYQPAGRGQLQRFCMVDPGKIPDPQAVLEVALGPLVRFERVV